MFGLFNKEKFICLGVNPRANWSHMDSIITPMNLHEYLKSRAYSKEEIKEIQSKLNQQNIPYKDIFNEFNWISEKQLTNCQPISTAFVQVISGVRQEFETSEPHKEIYEKYIAPSIIESLSQDPSNLNYHIAEVKDEYSENGVIVPLHFDRVLVINSNIKDEKTGRVFWNLEIKEKLEPFSLEPNSYQKVDILIEKILEKIKIADTDIIDEEKELLEILTESETLKGRYAELNGYYYLGVVNMKMGNAAKAEKYFKTLETLQSDISSLTISKDFLRPIGELYEEIEDTSMAVLWYKKAIKLSPTIGLKKKIAQLDKNFNI